jgi:RimJ/RimL family protein N-acetyltransferase
MQVPPPQPDMTLPSQPDEHRFRVAPLVGRHVFLRQIAPDDYRLLRSAELGGELAVRWRYRGSTLSPEQWAQGLWHSTLVQYLVIGVEDPTPLGLVAVYQANFQDQHAYLAVETLGARRPSPLMMFGVSLFVDYVFTCWSFHKLYLEVAEYNVGQFQRGIGRWLEIEGRLREHLWYDDRRWDQLLIAIYRDSWRRESSRMVAAARAPQELRARVRLPANNERNGHHE